MLRAEIQVGISRWVWDSEAFSRATLDAIAANVCVVDGGGRIFMVNRRWREFAASNGADPAAVSEGTSYVEVCRAVQGDTDEASRAAAAAIVDVVEGRRDSCAVEYGCHSPAERRWFIAEAARFEVAGVRYTAIQHTNITARRESEAAVRRAEARFRSLVELSTDFYWETDAEHRLTVRTNGRASASVSARINLGRRRWEIPSLTPDAEGWAAHRADLEARRAFRDFEFSRLAENGAIWQFAISGEPVFDERGGFNGYRGLGRDVSELRREARLLALEHKVTRTLADAVDPASGLQEVMHAICQAKGWESAKYWRVDAKSRLLRFAGAWSAIGDSGPSSFENITFAPGVGIAGLAWQSGEAVWIADASTDSRVENKSLIRGTGTRGLIAFPVTAGATTLGVLGFTSPQVREPDERMLAMFQAIGSQVGQFLHRLAAENVLRENEARFRSLAELSSDWYWEQDAEMRFTRFSGGDTRAKWGVDQLKSLGLRRWEIPGVNPIGTTWDAHRAMMDAHLPFRDLVYRRECEDGATRFVEASGEPVFDEAGAFTGYRGVARDVTSRMRDEQLRDLEHAVAGLLADGDDATRTLEAVLGEICRVERLDCSRLLDVDETADELHCVAAWCIPDEVVARFLERARLVRFGKGEGLAGLVWETGKAMWIPDVTQEPRAFKGAFATIHELRSAFLVPVSFENRIVGVMSLASRRMREPDDRLLRTAQAIGNQLGLYLERKRVERHLKMHARRQERIACFGQFALKRRSPDELVSQAIELLGEHADVVALFERAPGDEIVLRQAQGEGTADSVGRHSALLPEGAARRVLEGGEPLQLAEDYFRACPADWPWSGWMRQMRSGALVPVTHNGHAHGMLGIYSRSASTISDDTRQFTEAIGHLLSTALQREKAEERLTFLAQFDPLTDLPNRSLLEDRLRQTVAQSARKKGNTGVLFIDLDRFKLVNDTLGHQAGDELIRGVARRLEGCVRNGDTVGRISGDEFAIVLADLAHADDAGNVAQKILDAFAVPFDLGGSEFFVSISVGISIHPTDSRDVDALMRNADMAMYKVKKSGGNAYRYFTAQLNEITTAKLTLNTDLRRAIERREFELHYQPKVDLKTGALTGMEALMRWNHPQRGRVPPSEFIPALEDSGLILPVGEWVTAEACAQIRRWQDAGLQPVPVAINLSVKQFRRHDLDRNIQDKLAEFGVPAGLLELEVTESSLADDPEDAVRMLTNLREAGLKISVDDFGTGYSSLAYLTRLPIAALKIDRSFVHDVADSADAAAVVRAVIDMAHNLKFTVVAEGVETEWQAKFLRLQSCDQAQGYLYGKPMPAVEIEARLARAAASA